MAKWVTLTTPTSNLAKRVVPDTWGVVLIHVGLPKIITTTHLVVVKEDQLVDVIHVLHGDGQLRVIRQEKINPLISLLSDDGKRNNRGKK